tara:strand:+ start:1765 stop:2061 length:297 start_codon:yes stop_codon:yes gene_type:complete
LSFNVQLEIIFNLNQFEVKVSIRLRPSVLDPSGEAIKAAASKLGVEGINSLRIGKLIEVNLEAEEEKEAVEKIELLCDRLFANKVIEDFDYSLKEKYE